MNKYRIIKRKNSVFKDQDEFVLQEERYDGQMNSLMGQHRQAQYWINLSSWATLEAAKADKYKRETGLNPGEVVVG